MLEHRKCPGCVQCSCATFIKTALCRTNKNITLCILTGLCHSCLFASGGDLFGAGSETAFLALYV